ncbi:uncharacterized protein LOC135369161 [Ornithodoros turicata]|uniref:uncharacterized protein LOC135369161 n=1 Tax=Ornithodoros turicata TaxID=34597 RepID=UPI0031399CFB
MSTPGNWTIFRYVRDTYGDAALAAARRYLNLATKVIRFQCHLRFNQVCLNQHVVPPALRCKPLVDTAYGRRLAKSYERNCLRARTQENKEIIFKTRKQLHAAERNIQRFLDINDFSRIIIARKEAELLEHKRRSAAHQHKLSVLCPKYSGLDDSTTVINLSSKRLDYDHTSVLTKGMNYAIIPRSIPVSEIVSEVEDRLRQVKDKTAAIAARNKVIGILQNANLPPKNITKAEQNALKDLRNDDTIVILPADKGKATVVLNRDDYDSKMESILQDRSHFSELSGDPTAASERKIVAALRKLRTKKLITDSLYWKLFTSDGATPKIHGLPKVHKNNCPLRPIVSFIGSPSYNVSKFLAELLAPLVYKNDRSVKNSAEFCELIRDIRIDDGDVMMSFDVISLFTNVPIDVALSVVRTKLRADVDLEDRTDLSVEDILELLKLCLGQTFFQFKNRFFKQTDGCPMGSPISTTIANLVMEFVEDKALEDAGQFITFYRRYVDDTFVIIKKNFTNIFFDKLNSIHPNIQFTCEEEKEKKIAFLDVLVQRYPCGNLKTSVYRKPCDTGQVLHYGSGHSLQHKRSVVRSLLSRAMKIPSDHQTRHEEITKAKADLRRRAYHEQFISDTYHRMMNTRPEQAESGQERPMYVTIPYLKGVSEPIRRVLSQVVKRLGVEELAWKAKGGPIDEVRWCTFQIFFPSTANAQQYQGKIFAPFWAVVVGHYGGFEVTMKTFNNAVSARVIGCGATSGGTKKPSEGRKES